MISVKIWLVLIVAVLTAAANLEQGSPERKPEQKATPAFGVIVPTVFVDVVVTDRREKHVLDIRPDEFELFEEGTKQTIDAVEDPTAAVSRAQDQPASIGQPVQAASGVSPRTGSRPSIVTFLMDYSTTEFTDQKFIRDAAVKYVKERIGSNDWVAVYSLGGSSLLALQSFTNDKDLLAASLAKVDLSGTAHKAERSQLNSEIKREHQLGSAASGFSTTLGAGADYAPGMPLMGGSNSFSDSLRAILGQRVENHFTALRSFTDAMVARPVLTAIKSIALAERGLPGRKTLILFSSGFVVPPNVESLMRDAVDAANKANLAIYAIDTRGLTTKEASVRGELDSISAAAGSNVRSVPGSPNPINIGTAGSRASSSSGETLFDKARQVGSDQDESTLRFLANSTGGFPIHNTNDFELGLARVNEDIHNYYLLSYRPRNLEFDGKFREVRVEVSRPGLKVRARNGYFAIPPQDSLLTPEQRILFAAARQKRPEPGLPLVVSTDEFFPAMKFSAAVVTLEVPTDSLKLKESGALLEGTLQVAGLVSDSKGAPVTAFGQPLQLQFNKSQLDAVHGGFVSHTELIRLVPGKYFFEAVVQEPATGKYGYYFREVALDSPEDFKLSSLVLSKQVLRATAEGKSDPLVIGEVRVVPSADRQFHRGDRLIFYFDIYNAKGRDARSDVEVTLAIKKDGKPMAVKLPAYKIAEPIKDGNFRIQVAKYLELAGLPAGNYTLAVQAKEMVSGASSSSESSFTVIN